MLKDFQFNLQGYTILLSLHLNYSELVAKMFSSFIQHLVLVTQINCLNRLSVFNCRLLIYHIIKQSLLADLN